MRGRTIATCRTALALLGAAAILLGSTGCIGYGIELTIERDGSATFRVTLRDESVLGPEARQGLEGLLGSPRLSQVRTTDRAIDGGHEVVLEGRIDDVERIAEVDAFQKALLYLGPIDDERMLFQLQHEPLGAGYRGGDLWAQVTLPEPVARTNGERSADGRTVTWRMPLSAIAADELRLWAVMRFSPPVTSGIVPSSPP